GVYNDYAKGQRNIIKAANEMIMRPAIAAFATGQAVLSGGFHGAQEVVKQVGAELGAPRLGRELAALPEAFPAGLHGATGIPNTVSEAAVRAQSSGQLFRMAEIEKAKSLDTIGAGEEGYFGTKPVEPVPLTESAVAAKAETAPKPLSGAPEQPAAAP